METPFTIFGSFFKKNRLETGQSLRGFCLTHGLDAGNISKLERGLIGPPKGGKKLAQWAECLGLAEGSEQHQEFLDLAYACNGRVPPEILSDEQVVKKLPLIFRALRDQENSAEQLDKLVELIKRA